MSYYDIFFYILSGKATMIWEQDGERREEEFGPGDFVHMSPGSTHQWLNTGDEDLKLVEFGHFHNYAGQA
jgi:mannose-6-phosphate isomerase-like protein (cupin superfamily)